MPIKKLFTAPTGHDGDHVEIEQVFIRRQGDQYFAEIALAGYKSKKDFKDGAAPMRSWSVNVELKGNALNQLRAKIYQASIEQVTDLDGGVEVG